MVCYLLPLPLHCFHSLHGSQFLLHEVTPLLLCYAQYQLDVLLLLLHRRFILHDSTVLLLLLSCLNEDRALEAQGLLLG